jgi:biotin transporter BioY
VGPSYAGVLGPVAFATVLAHGVLHGGGAEATLGRAAGFLLAFGALGYVIGRVAGFVVEESVRTKLVAQMTAQKAAAGNHAPLT